ncbi:hypothetical protein [Planococcus salinarum]|uniref:hypothetical protein n=1 Tax=Planococcus salinarum TaxID=622695 RepID=UPI000E3EAEC4|nr:hypothetical protein [Planococcus salinarum]TAA73079.1 hypothetical protein D2909_03315 [Planococcus salinarum]
MKDKAVWIETIGFIIVIIGLVLMFSDFAGSGDLVVSLLLLGIGITIIGGLMGSMKKIVVLALLLAAGAAVTYFYTDNDFLFNALMVVSVTLILVDMILSSKRKKLQS